MELIKVRVNYFKQTGKFYTEEDIDLEYFDSFYSQIKEFERVVKEEGLSNEFIVVCNFDNHRNGYPVMLQPSPF